MTAYGILQMTDNIWRRRGGVTMHPVNYTGKWLRVLEPVEGSFLIATHGGEVVVERLDANDRGPDQVVLTLELGRLVQLIEDEFTDAEDLRQSYLEHGQFPLQIAQLSELAAGDDPVTARAYLGDLIEFLEGGER